MNDSYVRISFRLLCASLPLQVIATWLGETYVLAMYIILTIFGIGFIGRILMLTFFKAEACVNDRVERLTTDILTLPYSALVCGALYMAQGTGGTIDLSIAAIAAIGMLLVFLVPAPDKKKF